VISATTLSSVPDTTPPVVSITSPSNGTSYTTPQTITILSTASDNVSVTKVEFYKDGSLISTDTSSPYSSTWWSFTSSDNGTHALDALAYDGAGTP